MIGKKVVGEKPIPLVRVKEILERRKKEKEELEYGQRLTYDYVQKFSKVDPKKVEELMGKLLELGLKEHQAVVIVDFMPEKKEDFDLIFSKERTKLSENEINKVLEILAEYRK